MTNGFGAKKQIFECKNIGYQIGMQAILSDCSFSMAKGQFVVIVGPNGAGKTTLLQSICGLLPATGHMLWEGNDLRSLTAVNRARLISYLPQNGVIHWPMRVRDVVALGRIPHWESIKFDNVADSEFIETILDQCGILPLADRISTTLSGGERARVLLARAFATQAKLMLVDEPLNSLDPKYQLSVMKSLRDYSRSGACVIAVLHDIDMSLQFADRIVILKDGCVYADGRGSDLATEGSFDGAFEVNFNWIFDKRRQITGSSIYESPA